MAQGRFTSRTIATDPKLALLSETAELLYLKTIPHLDRDGLCTGEPYALLGMISPLRFSQLQGRIVACVDEWVTRELVIRYQTSVGMVLLFTGFAKQQKLQYEREAPSQYPPPPGYLRTAKGMMRATEVPWTADSRVLAKNPESTPKMIESGLQAEAEVQEQAEAEDQVQEQQQQQGDPAAPDSPAAAAVSEEVRQELKSFGITGKILNELSTCPIDHVQGWIEYAGTQERLRNPKGYVIARLRSGEPPPEVEPPEDDDDSYEALKRKYIPKGWEDIIRH